jgi:hypothetical protein
MKLKYLIIAGFLVCSFSACKKMDKLLVNPNSVDPSLANADLLLNAVQLNFAGVFSTASDFGAQLTRQQQMYGPLYNNAYSPTSFDGVWTTAYTGVIKNVDALLPIALEQKKYLQAGMAQILKAYTLGTFVDYFGNIPYSEANLGQENLNPKADNGAAVYAEVIKLLDAAIENINKTGAGAGPTNDLYYTGTETTRRARWTSLAKTLKLKFLLQTRLVDNTVGAKITALLTENDLINNANQDFNFKYGTQNSAPDSRHPHYAANYNNASTGSNNVSDFISNYFMWAIVVEKTGAPANFDPRRRFYFYRQRTNYADVNEQTCPCETEIKPSHYSADMPFCLVGSGYWGRDHGDNSGIPPDGPLRTTWGVYPAGGEFDAGQGSSVNNTRGGRGAGIEPIWNSAFTYFLQAEIAQAMGITVNGDVKSLLEKGVRASITKVIGFPATINVAVDASLMPSATMIDNYVAEVLALYDDETTDAGRLNVVMKEYYLALWGNGVEAYNNYRRTGCPNNMQPVKTTPNPGFFIRSFYYPSVYVNRNTNAPAQKSPGVAANKVFWDNNPDNFVK